MSKHALTLAGCLATLVGGLAAVVAVALVVAVITQWAWNGVMPGVFTLPTVTFWQAFQLNLLAGMLLKSTTAPTKS